MGEGVPTTQKIRKEIQMRAISYYFGYLLMQVNTREKSGTSRDKQGQAGTKHGQAVTRHGQAGTNRNSPCLSLLVYVCPCLSMYVPTCKIQSGPAPGDGATEEPRGQSRAR